MAVTNKSLNKIRVSRLLGGEPEIGLMDARIGMSTNQGTVRQILMTAGSGNQIQVTMGTGVPVNFYPHDLVVSYPVATGYGFPNNTTDVLFGHNQGLRANGSPLGSGNGMVFMTGNGTASLFRR